ncbi:MAG TPA: NmrA family NAD(P)-binding protein [Polyangiaceae bacterium]|nr:NmrA family NAD(P)-binding protein [Polyangiaceae bacterium]
MTIRGRRLVLVTGATGGQGGSVAIELLKKGIGVRALVPDVEIDMASARALGVAGAELVKGSFSDSASLRASTEGVDGVFSMQPDGAPASEFRALVDAAVAAGVEHYVHSSVSGVREQEAVLASLEGDMKHDYWVAKVGQERAVRGAPFRHRTYLRPSLLIDNMVLRAQFMYPRLASHGDILVAMKPEQRVSFVSYDTIGRVAAAAFVDPERFDNAEIELADAYVSHAQIAATLEAITGKRVTVTSVDMAAAIDMGLAPRVAHSHRLLTDVGYPARPEMLAPYGIEPLALRSWVERNAPLIDIGRSVSPRAARERSGG